MISRARDRRPARRSSRRTRSRPNPGAEGCARHPVWWLEPAWALGILGTRPMSACATLRRHMTQTLNPPTADAKVVEGSDGLLLEIDGQIVPNYDATFAPFEEGEVVSGRVVRIDNDEVLVDIGYKSEGVIPSNELSIRKNVDPHDEVELGEEVDALVLTKEDQDGRLIMSKKRARFEKAWRRIEAAAESGDPVEGTVIEVVKGGLIIDLGVRGFLPASLVDIRRVPNLDEYLGQNIQCKVIELNRSRNNVVLSRRAVLEEERKEQRQAILERLQPGLIIEGQISNIGAFVEILEGVEGLVHISELAQQHVENPREIVQPGDEVKVKILEIDSERRRLSLSIKRVEGQVLPRRTITDAGDLENVPELGLSEDVFAPPGQPDEAAPESEG